VNNPAFLFGYLDPRKPFNGVNGATADVIGIPMQAGDQFINAAYFYMAVPGDLL
jgi:hypothetical protein